MRCPLVLAVSLSLCAVARAQEPAELVPDAPETDCLDAVAASLEPRVPPPIAEPLRAPAGVPSGRAVAALDRAGCFAVLEAHEVPFHPLEPEAAEGVGIPIRLDGPIAGIRVASRGHSELHEILDCRLAVAVLAWSPVLRAAGVRGLLHYSVFRPGARVASTGRRSGHAAGLAIDLGVFEMEDGAALDVLAAWESRARGAPPCAGEHAEGPASAALRRVVCAVAAAELFQVVLTPHFDAAHANHLHLELREGVPWQFVR